MPSDRSSAGQPDPIRDANAMNESHGLAVTPIEADGGWRLFLALDQRKELSKLLPKQALLPNPHTIERNADDLEKMDHRTSLSGWPSDATFYGGPVQRGKHSSENDHATSEPRGVFSSGWRENPKKVSAHTRPPMVSKNEGHKPWWFMAL
jgi:hypothetical protein